MYAPYGTGALIGRRDTFLQGDPDLSGGGTISLVTTSSVAWGPLPDKEEAGSPNVVGAVALAEALRCLHEIGPDAIAEHEGALTARALERLRLLDQANTGPSLLPQEDGSGHALAYCSPGVAIYRNERAGPRAPLTHWARVVPSEEVARQLLSPLTIDPRQGVILFAGRELAGSVVPGDGVTIEVYGPEYVQLRACTASAAYPVLADSYYPGWEVQVNGQSAALLRAHVALRAVAVPPGEHVVEFTFEPRSWRIGALISAAGWTLVGVAALRRA